MSRKTRSQYGLLAVLLLVGLVVSACTQHTSVDNTLPAPNGTLRVGITAAEPPLAFRNNNSYAGLEVDFAKGLAQYLGRKVEFVQTKWPEQIPTLLKGKTDIVMSGMTITQARSYQVAFTEPYMVTGQISLVRREDEYRFQGGFSSLLSPVIKVGTVTGTTGDFLVEQNRANGERTQFKTARNGVDGLLDHTIDVLVYDLPTNLYYGARENNRGIVPITVPLTREHIAWAVRKEDTELLNQANNYLKSLKEKDQLAPMIQHWIPFYKNLL